MSKFKVGQRVVSMYGVGEIGLYNQQNGNGYGYVYTVYTNGQAILHCTEDGKAQTNQLVPVVFTLEEAKTLGIKAKIKVSYFQAVVKKDGKTMLSQELFKRREDAEKIEGFIGFSATPTITVEEQVEY